MRRAKRWPALLVIFILLILIMAYVYVAYQMVKPADDIICDGVYIETINLSGLRREQAQDKVDEYIRTRLGRVLRVDVNGKTVEKTLEDLGYSCEKNNYIEQALRVGKDGNPVANYAAIKEAREKHISYDLRFHVSEKKVKKFVKKECNKKCTKAKNADIKMQGGELVYTDAREGVTIDVDTTMESIREALEKKETEDVIDVEAKVVIKEPTVTKELASRCKDRIGSFETSFNTGKVGRSKNLANAARLIRGTVLNPGETFSVHDTISPLTEDNGYYAAPSYNNGKVEDSIGGGVCQVSTTLYNAVLRAELEIVERSPHSMVVSYVKPSMDAAIAGDYKDFKFRNNTQVPVYIDGGTYGDKIFFNVYGEETRSKKRQISFESETIETMQPGADKVVYDKTKPVSYNQVTQEAHIGYKAVLWKIVKQGNKTKKTQVNSSVYQAVPRYVTRGTLPVSSAPKAKETPKPSAPTDSGEEKKSGENKEKKPKATAAPKVPDAPKQDAEKEED